VDEVIRSSEVQVRQSLGSGGQVCPVRTAEMKVLVAIANWGTKNDHYLSQLIETYRSMSFDVDIVVISNLQKEVGPRVKVVVPDLRGKNPWLLPFAHKEILANRVNDYDLFIYSEDDMLITERNIRAFLEMTAALPEDEIVGFFRFEDGPHGAMHFPDVHQWFHWDPGSIRSRGEYQFAFFTNEHAACYVLTRQQLRQAISSGRFLVQPDGDGKYLLLEAAATDLYTRCGFTKLICISHFEDVLVHHLPNKYVDFSFGVSESELRRQLDALCRIGSSGNTGTSLFQTETKLRHAYYSKNYYEPARLEIISSIPSTVRTVLSIGCGWGATEVQLVQNGKRVVAIPLDSVIPGGAEAAGIKIVGGDFRDARQKLSAETFDCLLLSNVLHLVPSPVEILRLFRDLLADNGVVVLGLPNVFWLLNYWRRTPRRRFLDSAHFGSTGVHPTSRRLIRGWLREAGMEVESFTDVLSPRAQAFSRFTLGLTDPILASEFIVLARKAQ
jgi:2-polyprenyl-3-methyl-5-hydroxy-6-metoxy-1,4-benzoquinol methylase